MSGVGQKTVFDLYQAVEELFQAELYCQAMKRKLRSTPQYKYSGKIYAFRSKAEKEKEAAMAAARIEAEQAFNAADAYRREVLQYVQKLKNSDSEKAEHTYWFDCPFGTHDYSISDGNPDHYSFPNGIFLEKETGLCYDPESHIDELRDLYSVYSPEDGEYYYTFTGLNCDGYIHQSNFLYRNDKLLNQEPAAGVTVNILNLVKVENKGISYQTFNIGDVKKLSDSWALASERASQKLANQFERIENRVSQQRNGLSLSSMDMFGLGMISANEYNAWEGEKNQSYNAMEKKYREARDADLREYMQRSSRFFNQTGTAYTRTHLSMAMVAAMGYIGDRLAFIELYPNEPLVEMDIPADTSIDDVGMEYYNRRVSKHYKGCDLGPVLQHLARYYGPLMGPFDILEPKPISWMEDWQWRMYCEQRMLLQTTLNELS